MPENKRSRAALLALLGSRSVGATNRGEEDNAAAPAVFRARGSWDRDADEALTRLIRSECVPSARGAGWDAAEQTRGVDVGVLSSKKNCRGSNEMCEADATSALGGCCRVAFSSSRRVLRIEDQEGFEACQGKCPNSWICECVYDDGA